MNKNVELSNKLKEMIINFKKENNINNNECIDRMSVKEDILQKLLAEYKEKFKYNINNEEIKKNRKVLAVDFSDKYSLLFEVVISDYYKEGMRLNEVYVFEFETRNKITTIGEILEKLSR